MDSNQDIPDLDQRTVQNVMKLGGKKKLDALISSFSDAGPVRMQDLKEAPVLAQARTAAQALKISAGNLGLARLEDTCDQILSCKTWAPGSALLKQAEQAFERGRKALLAYRSGI